MRLGKSSYQVVVEYSHQYLLDCTFFSWSYKLRQLALQILQVPQAVHESCMLQFSSHILILSLNRLLDSKKYSAKLERMGILD